MTWLFVRLRSTAVKWNHSPRRENKFHEKCSQRNTINYGVSSGTTVTRAAREHAHQILLHKLVTLSFSIVENHIYFTLPNCKCSPCSPVTYLNFLSAISCLSSSSFSPQSLSTELHVSLSKGTCVNSLYLYVFNILNYSSRCSNVTSFSLVAVCIFSLYNLVMK